MTLFICERCNSDVSKTSLIGEAEPPAECASCGHTSFKRIGDDKELKQRYGLAIRASLATLHGLLLMGMAPNFLSFGAAPVFMLVGSVVIMVVRMEGKRHSKPVVTGGGIARSSVPLYRDKKGVTMPYGFSCMVIALCWLAVLYLLR
jgi:hypothetical protein